MSNQDAAAGSLEERERIVAQIRKVWPEVCIIVRGGSGFGRDEWMSWCEANGVDYVFGLARNERLRELIDEEMAEAAERQGARHCRCPSPDPQSKRPAPLPSRARQQVVQ